MPPWTLPLLLSECLFQFLCCLPRDAGDLPEVLIRIADEKSLRATGQKMSVICDPFVQP
jgi:hypothetical protein